MINKMRDTIVDIVNDVLQTNVSSDQSLGRNDLPGWDSLKHMELILRLEETFQIRMSLAQVGAMNSIDDIESIVKQCLYDAKDGHDGS